MISLSPDITAVAETLVQDPRTAIVIDGSGDVFGELSGALRDAEHADVRCINLNDPWRSWGYNPLALGPGVNEQLAIRTLTENLGAAYPAANHALERDCLALVGALHRVNTRVFGDPSPLLLWEQVCQPAQVLRRLLTAACRPLPEVAHAVTLFEGPFPRVETALVELRRRFSVFADASVAAVTSRSEFDLRDIVGSCTVIVVETGASSRTDALHATLVEQFGLFYVLNQRQIQSWRRPVATHVLRGGRLAIRNGSLAAFAYQGIESRFDWRELGVTLHPGQDEERDPARSVVPSLPTSASPRLRRWALTAEPGKNWDTFLERLGTVT